VSFAGLTLPGGAQPLLVGLANGLRGRQSFGRFSLAVTVVLSHLNGLAAASHDPQAPSDLLVSQLRPRAAGERCGVVPKASILFTVGTVPVLQLPGQRAFFFEAGMTIDADGAPDAYNPEDTGLDFLANAGRPGRWWALVTDNDGQPVVQGPSDPAPGHYVSTTALQDLTKAPTDPHRYVNSKAVPYIVLPGGSQGGAKLGDFAVVLNRKNGRQSPAIFADVGPKDHLGEGSIALADDLGIDSNPKRGGAASGIVYIVFPGSGNRKPRPLPEIKSEASKLLELFGGIDQVLAALSDER